jgi:hypothetical protein
LPVEIGWAITDFRCRDSAGTERKLALSVTVQLDKKPARIRPERTFRLLWTGVFIAGLLALPMKVLPPFFQQNQPVLALVLPVPLC